MGIMSGLSGSASDTGSSLGIIAGITIGAFLLVLLVGLFCWRRSTKGEKFIPAIPAVITKRDSELGARVSCAASSSDGATEAVVLEAVEVAERPPPLDTDSSSTDSMDESYKVRHPSRLSRARAAAAKKLEKRIGSPNAPQGRLSGVTEEGSSTDALGSPTPVTVQRTCLSSMEANSVSPANQSPGEPPAPATPPQSASHLDSQQGTPSKRRLMPQLSFDRVKSVVSRVSFGRATESPGGRPAIRRVRDLVV